jgi:hypothetical protein
MLKSQSNVPHSLVRKDPGRLPAAVPKHLHCMACREGQGCGSTDNKCREAGNPWVLVVQCQYRAVHRPLRALQHADRPKASAAAASNLARNTDSNIAGQELRSAAAKGVAAVCAACTGVWGLEQASAATRDVKTRQIDLLLNSYTLFVQVHGGHAFVSSQGSTLLLAGM